MVLLGSQKGEFKARDQKFVIVIRARAHTRTRTRTREPGKTHEYEYEHDKSVADATSSRSWLFQAVGNDMNLPVSCPRR